MTRRAGMAHGNANTLPRRPCLGENCKFCSRHEDWDQLAGPAHKTFVRAARVAGQVFPQTADEEFGTLAWSMAQQEDPALGPVYEWVRAGKRPSGEEVTHSEQTKAYWAQ